VFITAEELEVLVERKEVAILNASFSMDGAFNPAEQHAESHIKGAQFVDVKEFRDTESKYPHMLPTAESFAKHARELGISQKFPVVVYDGQKGLFAHRVAFVLRANGVADVRVLDGGFSAWTAKQLPVDENVEKSEPLFVAEEADQEFTADESIVRNFEHIQKIVEDKTAQIVDTRPAPMFEKGSFEDAINVPAFDLYNEDNTVKSTKEIAEIFAAAGVDLKQPIVTSCQAGVMATSAAAALAAAGAKQVAIYDGSWAEYSDRGIMA